jgi:hypothetical protein
MLKLIDIDPTFFHEEPVIQIIDFDHAKGMVKSAAADSRISQYAEKISPDPSKIYVHILAMGAGEYYGANRNADYFPEENLKIYHESFATSPAHIFKHHINKNPEIAIGQVIFSIYNDRMHRVEIIAWIDKKKGADVVEKIERGEFPSTSMACHTPYDTCSICGNQARSRGEYCVHLRDELGKIHADGKKTMAINDGPLRFFDMSIVFRPADVTSSVLQKVASDQAFMHGGLLGSAESAFLQGLQEKAAEMKKLSELVKEVEGSIVSSSPTLSSILAKVKDPKDDVLDLLVQFDIHHVIHALAELGISPSVGFFAKYIGQKLTGQSVEGIEHLVQGLLQEDSSQLPVPDMMMAKEASASVNAAKLSLVHVLTPFVKSASLFPEMVMQRSVEEGRGQLAAPSVLFPHPEDAMPWGNMGFIGNGPQVVPDSRLAYRSLKETHDSQSPGLLKTLFMIGGAAVAAKWLLSRMIESKMQEQQALLASRNSLNNQRAPVKIVLVKSAQEAISVQELVKASLLNNLKGL